MSSAETPRPAIFRPDVFEVGTFEQARRITVTPEQGTTTEERWEKETAFLLEDISRFLPIRADSRVLDYGCGPGRVAKVLIERFGCRVIGVDSSKAMRLLSPGYVLSEQFVTWAPEVLDLMVDRSYQVDFAISLWVIQHVLDPKEVIQRIYNALAPGGVFYALNAEIRCVPTDQGWVNDGFDVQAALRQTFEEQAAHRLPEAATTQQLAAHTWIQVLRKPA